MKKILIVDDHSDIRHLIRLLLERSFQILEAENGTEALEIIRRERPDALVLDIMMPGDVDGLHVLSAIKSNAELKSIHVAMVTARGQARDFEHATSLGADAYFVKPFSPLALASHIRKALAD